MILLIDNYDSFTFNLAHYIEETGMPVKVLRNDKTSIKEIKSIIKPSKIIISPGPCTPNEAGICIDVIKEFYNKLPILGVCLGHQSIGQAFGGIIVQAKKIMHGKISSMTNETNSEIFRGLPKKFDATRYHSLIIDKKSLSKNLKITAETDDGLIMGVKHKEYNIHGVQFHPESIKTKIGIKILKNFISYK